MYYGIVNFIINHKSSINLYKLCYNFVDLKDDL